MNTKQLLDNLKEADNTSYAHSVRCGNYLAVFAEEHGLDMVKTQDYREAGYLHDIGKLGIMKYIKSDVNIKNLSPEEAEGFKKALTMHVRYSHPMLQQLPDCKQEYLDAADYHHAYYNDPKAGYSIETVRGTSDRTPIRTAIPEVAQMLSIVDVYDALTDPNRPYRNGALPDDEVNKIMDRNLDKGQFNPSLYQEFKQKVIPKIKQMTEEDKMSVKINSEQKNKMLNMFGASKSRKDMINTCANNSFGIDISHKI